MQLNLNGPEELSMAAEMLIKLAGKERILLFEGEMGAGKTTFIKALAHSLGVRETVSSPTFSIVNEYHYEKGIIYHFDFYRIKNIEEAFDIGYEEYFYSGQYCFLEWPEKIEMLLPESYIKTSIQVLGPTRRLMTFTKIEH